MFEFDSVCRRINTYLEEDRQLQKMSNEERKAGNEELSRQLFVLHKQLRKNVIEMIEEVKCFIKSFLEKWEEL